MQATTILASVHLYDSVASGAQVLAEKTVKGRTVIFVIATLVIAAGGAAVALSDVREAILESNPPAEKKSSVPKQFQPPSR